MLHIIVGTIMHGYNTVEHSVTGTINCTGATEKPINNNNINYCKALI